MNIKRYKKNINIEHIKQVKNITEITSQDGGVRMNARIQELQRKLSLNMDKAVLLAEKNTIRNEQGYVVLCKDDEWRDEDEWEE
jgi:hypothetical protein